MKCRGTEVFQVSEIFRLWNICTTSQDILGMGHESEHKIIYVSYTPVIQPEDSFTHFNNFVHETKFCVVGFSTCGIVSMSQMFRILEHF
jgi:hypothetical protein